MPYFNYPGAVWGNIYMGLADKLQKMQNRAARILTFSNYDVRSSVLLDELGWERLEYVRLKQLSVTMYKSIIIFPRRIWGGSLPTPQMYIHTILELLSEIIMPPDPEMSLQKEDYTTKDLFCGTRFPQRLENCLV